MISVNKTQMFWVQDIFNVEIWKQPIWTTGLCTPSILLYNIHLENNTATWPHTQHATRYPTVRAYLLEKQSDFNNKPLLVQLQNWYQTIFCSYKFFFFLFSYSGKKNNKVRHPRVFANNSTIKLVLGRFGEINWDQPIHTKHRTTTLQLYDSEQS